jgi:hypothetical protein
MKKINLIRIEFFIFLILIPFIFCDDGSGAIGGQQNLCGDGFCQPSETVASCPADCQGVSPGQPSLAVQAQMNNNSNSQTNTQNNQQSGVEVNSQTNNPSSTSNQNNPTNQPASAGNVPIQNSFFSSSTFFIILGAVVLLIVGIVIFFLIKNKNKVNSTPGADSTTEAEVSTSQ